MCLFLSPKCGWWLSCDSHTKRKHAFCPAGMVCFLFVIHKCPAFLSSAPLMSNLTTCGQVSVLTSAAFSLHSRGLTQKVTRRRNISISNGRISNMEGRIYRILSREGEQFTKFHEKNLPLGLHFPKIHG